MEFFAQLRFRECECLSYFSEKVGLGDCYVTLTQVSAGFTRGALRNR